MRYTNFVGPSAADWSQDVLPRLIGEDVGHIGPVDTERLGDHFRGDALRVHLAYLNDLSLGQFRAPVLGSLDGPVALEHMPRVLQVLCRSRVFKVAVVAIGWVAVDVVDMVALWAWANERFGHEPMEEAVPPMAVSAYADAPISVRAHVRAQSIFTDAPYLAALANFVAAIGLRYRAPFHFSIVTPVNRTRCAV